MQLYRELPIKVSNLAMNDFKENFRRQGVETEGGIQKWEKRKSEGGRKSKTQRPILIKSGRLKRSFKPRPAFGVARVINDAPYAKVNNEGFKGTEKIKAHKRLLTKRVQVGTGVYSVKTKKERVRTEKKANGYAMVKAFIRKVDITARPFMVTTKSLMQSINAKVTEELNKMFK